MTKFQKEAIEVVANSQGISKSQAQQILESEEEFIKIMAIKDRQIRMEMMDTLLPRILQAADKKIDNESMEQLKHAITAWGIAKDKAMGQDRYSGQGTVLQVGGKNVQVNVGFKFTPFKKK